jgi:hypothetical protein
MPLATYVAPREKVALGKNDSFTVRGLSTADVSKLLQNHRQDLEALFSVFEKSKELSTQSVEVVTMYVLEDMPSLAAELILIASDEPDASLDQVVLLPMPSQLDALGKIMKLTFEEAGGLKNFVAMILTLLRGFGINVASPMSAVEKIREQIKLNQH